MADNDAKVRFTAQTDDLEAGSRRATAAIGQVRTTVEAASKSFNGTRLNVANLAAQFNDIGVQLASGTSPLQIALQQGTQINQVLGAQGATGTLKLLGAAFLNVVSPVNLITIGIIALGGAAIQALGAIIPKIESATEAMQRHRDAVHAIVAGYADAEKASAEYFDALKKASPGLALAALGKEFTTIRAESTAARTEIAKTGEYVAQLAKEGQNGAAKMADLVQQFMRGELSANGLREAMQKMRLDKSVSAEVYGLAGNLDEAAKKAWDLNDALVAASHIAVGIGVNGGVQMALDSKLAAQRSAEQFQADLQTGRAQTPEQKGDAAARQKELELRDTQGITEALKQQEVEQARLLAIDQAKQGLLPSYKEQQAAIRTTTANLKLQLAELTMTDREKAIAIELSKAHVTATSREGQEISKLAGRLYDEAKALATTKAALSQLNQMFSTVFSGIISGADAAFSGLINGTMNWKQAMGTALNSVWQTTVQIVEQMVGKWLAAEATILIAHLTGNEAKAASDEEAQTTSLLGMLGNAIKSIFVDSKDTAAGVTANLAPTLGPAALPIGLAAGASVAALASFDTGAWSLPRDQMAMVHQGEMIVPQNGGFADAMRSMMMGGGGGDPMAAAQAIGAVLGPMLGRQSQTSARTARTLRDMQRRMR